MSKHVWWFSRQNSKLKGGCWFPCSCMVVSYLGETTNTNRPPNVYFPTCPSFFRSLTSSFFSPPLLPRFSFSFLPQRFNKHGVASGTKQKQVVVFLFGRFVLGASDAEVLRLASSGAWGAWAGCAVIPQKDGQERAEVAKDGQNKGEEEA